MDQRLGGTGFPHRYRVHPDDRPPRGLRVVSEALGDVPEVAALAARAPSQPQQHVWQQKVEQQRIEEARAAHTPACSSAARTSPTEGGAPGRPRLTACAPP